MAAHSLARIKRSLVNTPHLIEQCSFDSIMEYVNQRIEGSAEIVAPQADSDGDHGHRYVSDTATGVMHINGPLTYRTSGWEALCGGTSYEMLKDQMEYFVANGAKTVAMLVDSGGGEAHGMMDSANYVRKLADDNGIKIIAYVDGMSASAAYGFSCISDEIVMSSDSQVGSIGVLIQLMNNSKQLAMNGIERSFITAGADKVPFGEDGAFTDSFKERLQEQVDTLYESFTGHVAMHRNIDINSVKATEANVFMSTDALTLGLADKVMTVEEFYNYLADEAQNNIEDIGMGMKDAFKFGTKEDKAEMTKLEELQTLLKVEQEATATAKTELAAHITQLAESESAIAELTSKLAEFQTAQAEALEAAAIAKTNARHSAIAEWVPEAEVESYMSHMGSLPEESFTFMVGQLKAVHEAKVAGFKAIGEDGAEDEKEDVPVSTTEAIRIAGIERAKALRG